MSKILLFLLHSINQVVCVWVCVSLLLVKALQFCIDFPTVHFYFKRSEVMFLNYFVIFNNNCCK